MGGRAGQAGQLHSSPGQNRGHPALSSFCPGEIDSGDRGDEFPRHVQRTSDSVTCAFGPTKEAEEKSIFHLSVM